MSNFAFNAMNQVLESLTSLRVQPSADERLRRVRINLLKGFSCDHLVDVGANNGDWSRRLRQDGFTGKIDSFEPTSIFQELEKKSLKDSMWNVHNLALSDFAGEAIMNLASNNYLSSSLLRPSGIQESNKEISFKKGEKVQVTTLDTFFTGQKLTRIYLKLDVQGSEMSVLNGSARFLESCYAIEFESALRPQYEGETSHYQIMEWLHSLGFRAKQVVPTHWNEKWETIALDSIVVRDKT